MEGASPSPSPTTQMTMAEQIRRGDLLEQASAPVWAYLKGKSDGDHDPAFARSIVDYERLTLQVMWKGKPPPKIQAMEGTTASGVRVPIVNVPYSQGDITSAGRKVFAAANEGDFPLPVSSGANLAFDGLKVAFTVVQLETMDREAVAQQIKRLTGIPATIVAGEVGVPLAYP